jgi:Ca2+-binding RTX toxin-like protein
MPVTYNLNNLADIQSLLNDKDFMGYMRDYFAKNMTLTTPEKPISDFMAIKALTSQMGNVYSNYSYAAYPPSFVRDAIESYQKWTGGLKNFKYTDNGVYESTRQFGQTGWVATAFMQTMLVVGTTNRGSDWDKLQIARYAFYAFGEAMFLAKNIWYVSAQRGIKATYDFRMEELTARGIDAIPLQNSQSRDNAHLDLKNAGASALGLALFTVLGALAINRNLVTKFGNEKDPVLLVGAQLNLAGSFMVTVANALSTISSGLTALEKYFFIREVSKVMSTPVIGGPAVAANAATLTSVRLLSNVTAVMGLAASILQAASIVVGMAAQAHVLRQAGHRMNDSQKLAAGLEIGMQSAAAVILTSVTVSQAAGLLATTGGPAGVAGAAILAVSAALLFSPVQIEGATAMLRLAGRLDHISDSYKEYGFGGYSHLADARRTQGALMLSNPAALGGATAILSAPLVLASAASLTLLGPVGFAVVFMLLAPLAPLGGLLLGAALTWSFLNSAFGQVILEARADSMRTSILNEYGSFENFWGQSYNAEANKVFGSQEFLSTVGGMVSSLSSDGSDRLLVLLGLSINELQSSQAADLREGGSLPASAFFSYALSKRGESTDGSLTRSILDKNTGTIDLSTDLIRQSVIAYGPLRSPSSTGVSIRKLDGKDTYSTRIVYVAKQWNFVDENTSTTISLKGLSLSNLDNNDNLRSRLSMGGGNDVVFAGARHFEVDGGSGMNGVDYSDAFVDGAEDKSSMTLQQAADGSFTVKRSGVGVMAYEEIKTHSASYGKRAEKIEYIEAGFSQVSYSATDLLTNIHWIKGSLGRDTFFGGDQDNFFIGSGGGDRYDGGDGTDWVDYSQLNAEPTLRNTGIRLALDSKSVQESLGLSPAQLPAWIPGQSAAVYADAAGVRQIDLLANIENIRGTSKADLLVGNDKANVLMGDTGDDTIDGRSGNDVIGTGIGRDVIRGGDGNDMIYAEHADSQLRGRYVMIRKNAGVAQDLALAEMQVMSGGANAAQGKAVVSSGSWDQNQFKASNLVDGKTGGSAATDGIYASGSAGGGWIQVDLGASTTIDAIHLFGRTDAWAHQSGDYTVYVSDRDMSGISTAQIEASTGVFMSRHDGQAGRVTLNPETFAYLNQKTIDGGQGTDSLDYRYTAASSSVGIDASLLTGNATTWTANLASSSLRDSFTNIENLGGTNGADRLVGDNQANSLNGYAGNDVLDGQAGDDLIVTGTGRDTVLGGSGDDSIVVQRRSPAIQVRYVMVRKNAGVQEYLSLAELQVMSDGVNVALGRSVITSGQLDAVQHKAANMVDGKTDGNLQADGIFASSTLGGGWIQVDLTRLTTIDAINLYGRTDDWKQQHNGHFTVYVSDQDMSAMSTQQIEALAGVFSNRYDGSLERITKLDGKTILAADQKTIDGGEGNDTVDYSVLQVVHGAGIEADLSNEAAQTVKTWRNADGTINAASVTDSLKGIESLGATEGNDKILGSEVDNRLSGHGGDDHIEGRGGNDTIVTGLGRDTVLGGSGDDSIVVQRRSPAIQGRYVMVRKNAGVQEYLSLAELQVMSDGVNVALGRSVITSGQLDAGQHKAANMVDGKTDGNLQADGIFASSTLGGGWIQVDLTRLTTIDEINLYGRTDDWKQQHNGHFTVYVSDQDMSAMSTQQIEALAGVFSNRYDGSLERITKLDGKTILAADQKTIDGGEGNDTVDYSVLQVVHGAGIEADLSNEAAQTVKTWRNADGTINAASVTDSLKGIESLGATEGNDKILGSDADNRLWGYGGNDVIEGRGGDDTIATGLGRDSVLGGAGDDKIVIAHERQKVLWRADAPLGAMPVTLAAMGRVSDADLANAASTIKVDGVFSGGQRQAQVVSVDRSQAGRVTFWAQYWDGSATKAVKMLLADTASGGVQASVLGAASVARDVTGQRFDWNREHVIQLLASETFDSGMTLSGWSSTSTNNVQSIDGYLGGRVMNNESRTFAKTYDFGKDFANTKVTLEFDLYQAATRQERSFEVKINESPVLLSQAVSALAPRLGSTGRGDVQTHTTATGNQMVPKSAMLSDGGYIQVWASDHSGSWRVYGQRFDANGARLGGEFQINVAVSGTHGYIGQSTGVAQLDVAGLDGGGFVVTWASDTSGTWDIYARSYSAQGEVLAKTDGRVNTTSVGTQLVPQISKLADGGYVIIWASDGQDSHGSGVYGQRYSSRGVAVGEEFLVNSAATAGNQGSRFHGGHEEGLSVTGLKDGGFVVSWFTDVGGTGEIMARRYDRHGTAGSSFKVSERTSHWQWLPQVADLADGGFLVTWADSGADGSGYGVYAQRYTNEGIAKGVKFQINTHSVGHQGGATEGQDDRLHDVVGLADGGWAAVWCSEGQDGSFDGVYLQVYDSTGSKIGGETRVNTVTNDRQRHVTISALKDGGFVVGWDSHAQDGHGWGTFHKVYEASGLERMPSSAPDVQTHTTATGNQMVPKSAMLSDGGYIQVWASDHSGSWRVYGQRFDANGARLGGEFQINVAVSGTHGYIGQSTGVAQLDVAGLDGGGFVVTWASDTSGTWDIYARSYSAQGEVLAKTDGRVNTTSVGTQLVPQISKLADGGYVIIWASDGQDSHGSGVYGQRYSSRGVAVGEEFLVNSAATAGNQGSRFHGGHEEGLSVTGLKDGGFVVSWFTDVGGTGEIMARRYDRHGTAGSSFKVSERTSHWQWLPQVADLADGGFLVTWADSGADGSGYGVYAQRYTNEGIAKGVKFQINTHSVGHQGGATEGQDDRLHDVVGLADGGWAAVWCSEGQDGSFDGVYLQVYDSTGSKIGGETRVNTVTNDRQRHVTISALKDGGFVVGWDSHAQDGHGWGAFHKVFNGDGSARVSEVWHAKGTAVQIAPALVLAPALDRSSLISQATVVMDNYKAGDRLAFGALNGISASWDSSSYTLVLEGEASMAEYQSALRSVTYHNPGANPDLTTRSFSFSVKDTQGNTSAPVKARLTLLADNYASAPSASQDWWTQLRRVRVQGVTDNEGRLRLALGSDLNGTWAVDNLTISRTQAVLIESKPQFDVKGLTVSGLGTLGEAKTIDGGEGNDTVDYSVLQVVHGAGIEADLSNEAAQTVKTWRNADGTINAASVTDSLKGIESLGATEGNDKIVGSEVDNRLWGYGGNDVIEGRGGDDTIATGLGRDSVLGGAGDDKIVIAHERQKVLWRADAPLGAMPVTLAAMGRVSDADLANAASTIKVDGVFSGGQRQAQVVSVDRSQAGRVTFWAQYWDGSATKAVKMLLADTASGGVQASVLGAASVARDVTGQRFDWNREHVIQLLASETFDSGMTLSGWSSTSTNNVQSIDGYLGGRVMNNESRTFAKTYDFGKDFANTKVTLEFDLYQAATRQERSFEVKINESPVLLSQAVSALAPRLGSTGRGDVQTHTTATGNQMVPKSAMLSDGGYIQVWASDHSGSWRVYGQRFDANGARLGGEFQINVAVSGTHGYIGQSTGVAQLDVAGLDGGGFVVTWASDTSGTWDIYARSYSAQGEVLAKTDGRVNTTSVGTQLVPQISKLADGGYVIIWASDGQDSHGSGVYGQRYSSRGVAVGEEFLVNSAATAGNQGSRFHGGHEEGLSVTGLKDGGFVVSWFTDVGGTGEIMARRYDRHGTAGSSFKVSERTSHWQWLPQVADLADGGFLVTWADSGADGSGYGVYAQRYTNEGIAKGVKFQINTHSVGHQGGATEGQDDRLHDVVGLADGGWAAVWCSEGQDGSFDGVYLQVYDSTGSKIGGETRVNTVTNDRQRHVTISALKDGGFVVGWDSHAQDGHGWGTFHKVYEASGLERMPSSAPDVQTHTTATGNQMVPKSAMLSDGGYIQVWASDHSGSWRVYGQRFDANGARLGGEFQINVAVSGTHGYIGQSTGVAQLDVAGLDGGGFVVTWASDTSGTWDIYARSYSAQGEVLAKTDGRVNTTSVGTQLVPQISKLADGGYVIIWASDGQDSHGSGVYGQRYSSRGVAVGEEFLVNSAATAGNQGSRFHGGHEEGLSVTGLKDGGFVVSWFTDVGGTGEIMARRYDRHGTAGSSFKVSERTSHWQWLPQVADLADGGFLVTWADSGADGSGYGVYAQRYTNEGIAKGVKFQINTHSVGHQGGATEGQDDRLHDVVGLADGGWAAVWCSEGQDGSFDGVYLQVYDSTGSKIGGETRVNTVTNDRQRHVTISALKDGGFVVGWDSHAQDGHGWGAFHKVFNGDGSARVSEVWHAKGTAVQIAPALVLAPALDRSSLISQATVVMDNYKAGDRLAFGALNGISASWDSSSYTLVLEGEASMAEYQSALRSVTYHNPGANPDLTTRSFSFSVKDTQGNTSAPVKARLTLLADNYASAPSASQDWWTQLRRVRVQGVTDNEGRLRLALGSDLNGTWAVDNLTISRTQAVLIESKPQFDVKGLTVSGLGTLGEAKTIDGGEGNDTVDYSVLQVVHGAGIEADLSNEAAQTVKTWRNADGTINAASVTDSLKGIESLGATEGNDKIVGSEVDNRLWGHGGDDYIEGRGGNDTIVTGLGRDTVLGGSGDDVVQVEHTADGDFFSDSTALTDTARTVASATTVDRFNFFGSAFVLSGTGIASGQAGKVLQDEGASQGAGTRTLWIGFFEGSQSRAVRVQFANAADGGVSARILAAKSTAGDATASAFDWTAQGTSAGSAYTLASMKLWKAFTKFADAKSIDGGEGKDTVSYTNLSVQGSTGIEADLSNAASQTVKTWRNADGTINDASVTDSLRNIESLVGTTGNDKITGSAADNKLWGNAGNDHINGQAGNDMIATGTGRDTVLGGLGDDTIAIAHERQKETWTSAGYVTTLASTLVTTGRVNEINLLEGATEVILNGAAFGRDQSARIVRADRSEPGRLTFWAQFWDGSATRAVQVEVRDTASGGVEARVLGAAFVQRNVTGQDFDWTSNLATQTTVATTDAMAGQGIKRLALAGLGGWGDVKTVDGGEGMDTADYQAMDEVDGAGIEADLSNTASQTVKTWRNIDGTIRTASVTDDLKDIENLVGTSGNDRITGSALANRLWAGDGDDWVHAGDGADRISTGAGRDTIMGGAGDDAIFVEQEQASLNSRYLLIRHTPGVALALSLSEVKVWSGGKNVALGAQVIVSADGAANGSPGSKVTDGAEGTLVTDAYLSQATDGSSWLMIDLGKAFAIDRIELSTLATSAHGPLGGNLALVLGGLDLRSDASNYARLTARSDVRYAELAGQQVNGISGLLSANGRLSFGVERFIRSKALDGGAGEDLVSYRDTQGAQGVGIHGSLDSGRVHTWYENGAVKDGGATDTLVGIENLGGTDVNDWLEGNAGANKLVGYGGNDRIRGGGGNDQLAGGLGSDTYEFSGDWGTDAVYEEDKGDTVTDADQVVFDAEVGYQNLWFSRQGDALVVSRMGSSNHVVVDDWYADVTAKRKVERFECGGRQIVGVQNVNAFVSALAAFSGSAPGSLQQMSTFSQSGVYTQMARYWVPN